MWRPREKTAVKNNQISQHPQRQRGVLLPYRRWQSAWLPHRRHPPWWCILTGLSSPFGGAFSRYLLRPFFSRHVLKPSQRKERFQRPPQPEAEALCPRRSPQPPAPGAAHAPLRAQRRSFGFFCSWLFPTHRHGALCSRLALRFWLCIPAAGICDNSGGFCVSQIVNN